MKKRFRSKNQYWLVCEKYLKWFPLISIFILIVVCCLYEWQFIYMPGSFPMLSFTGVLVGLTMFLMMPLGNSEYQKDFLPLAILWLCLGVFSEYVLIYTNVQQMEESYIIGVVFVCLGLLNLLNTQGALKTGLRG